MQRRWDLFSGGFVLVNTAAWCSESACTLESPANIMTCWKLEPILFLRPRLSRKDRG